VFVALAAVVLALASFVASFVMGRATLSLVAVLVFGLASRLAVEKGTNRLNSRQVAIHKYLFSGQETAFHAAMWAMSVLGASIFSRGLSLGAAVAGGLFFVARHILPKLYTRTFQAKVLSRGFEEIDAASKGIRWFDGTNQKFRSKLSGYAKQVRRVDLLLPVALGLVAVTGWPILGWLGLMAVGLIGAAIGGMWVMTIVAVASSDRYHAREIEVENAIRKYAPEIICYFSAPSAASAYQMTQWLPFLESGPHRLLTVTRERNLLGPLAGASQSPVVWIKTLKDLDYILQPSVKVVAYSNNGVKNGHMIRHPHLTHIQLLHGESDKVSSVSKATRAFDVIAVSGLAAVNRYERFGVSVPDTQFAVIGRPSVTAIEPQTNEHEAVRRILYAPTWEGYQDYNDFSSLGSMGFDLIKEITRQRPDLQIIVKPHPMTGTRNKALKGELSKIQKWLSKNPPKSAGGKAPGRKHRFIGPSAKQSLAEVFNQTDALITDLCSVPADFLQARKPMAIANARGFSDEELKQDFPTSHGAYNLVPDLSNLSEVIGSLTGSDPLRSDREIARIHVLGGFDGPSDDRFQLLLDRCINGEDLDDFRPHAERERLNQHMARLATPVPHSHVADSTSVATDPDTAEPGVNGVSGVEQLDPAELSPFHSTPLAAPDYVEAAPNVDVHHNPDVNGHHDMTHAALPAVAVNSATHESRMPKINAVSSDAEPGEPTSLEPVILPGIVIPGSNGASSGTVVVDDQGRVSLVPHLH